jgi:hypothetical protein
MAWGNRSRSPIWYTDVFVSIEITYLAVLGSAASDLDCTMGMCPRFTRDTRAVSWRYFPANGVVVIHCSIIDVFPVKE